MKHIFAIVVGIAGIVGAVFTVLQYYSTPSSVPPSQDRSVRTETTIVQPPKIDLTPDPTTAAVTKVILRSLGPGLGGVAYSVSNLGWADDMRDVEYSLWAVKNGTLSRLDQRRVGFIARGEYSAAENIVAPYLMGRMVVCVSYQFKNHRVNVIDFYTNEGSSSFQRQIGEMRKFRQSLSQVDGSGDLCRSMPRPVAGLI